MTSILNKGKFHIDVDWKLLIPILLLCIVGIITLLSTTILPEGGFDDLSIVYKQLMFVGIGLVFYFLFSYIDLSIFKYWQVLLILFIGTVGLLGLTLLFGPEINGTRRWLYIGGFQLQPSEIAKFTIIIGTAGIFSMKEKFNELILLVITFLSTAVIFILVNIEPAGSMSLLILAIWFIIAFLALSKPLRNTLWLLIAASSFLALTMPTITGNNLWYLLIILTVVLIIFIFYSQNNWKLLALLIGVIGTLFGATFSYAWTHDIVLHDYQKGRIEAYINPSETESDENFNVNQARIAIGSGQLWGKGFGNGTQSKRNFLPEHQTDFIFASFAEEFGLVGSVLVLGLYAFIILHCFVTAINVIDNPLYSLICLGVGIKLLLEVFINIGTNTGLIPATGIPLPLMSAGGSITMMTLISLGLVQNIYIKHTRSQKDKSAEMIEVYEE